MYLHLEDAWTNTAHSGTVTPDDRRCNSFAATSRQFVNLLQSAIGDVDQDISITMEQNEETRMECGDDSCIAKVERISDRNLSSGS